MDFANFSQDHLLIAAVSASFVVGALFARVVFGSRKSAATAGEDPRNKRIRQLEADLKVAERKLDEYSSQLETKAEEFDQSMATVHDLNSLLEERNGEVEGLRQEIKSEVAKTRELRRELSDRAAETIREHVRAEEAQTELAVARAGSDAIISEFSRLQEDDADKESDTPEQSDLLDDASLFDEPRP